MTWMTKLLSGNPRDGSSRLARIKSSLTPFTLHRFQTKMILCCSGYGYRPHYIAENDHRKRIVSKTLSRVERFENGTVWKRCFPSVDGENDTVWKRWRHHNNSTWMQTTQPWVADKRFLLASLLIAVTFSLLILLLKVFLKAHANGLNKSQNCCVLLGVYGQQCCVRNLLHRWA